MSDKNIIDLQNFRALVDKKTREEIAKGIGCDTSLVTKHYNGDRNITLEYAIKYAKFFDVSVDYLIGVTTVATTNANIKFVCDYTGLSESTISILHNAVQNNMYAILNPLIEYGSIHGFFYALENYVYSDYISFAKDYNKATEVIESDSESVDNKIFEFMNNDDNFSNIYIMRNKKNESIRYNVSDFMIENIFKIELQESLRMIKDDIRNVGESYGND